MSESAVPTYSLLCVETTPEDTDAMIGRLTLLGAEAIEERDGTTLQKGGSLGVTLVASFATHSDALEAREAVGDNARIESIVGDEWRDGWKKHWRPTPLCEGIVVVPSWIEYTPQPNERVMRMDPGRAFGTGQHASTVLAAQAIGRIVADAPPATMLDLGCGSGVLAFAAVMLGVARVEAWDLDPDAIAAASENAHLLGLDARVAFRVGGVDAVDTLAPLVVANIEASVLVPFARSVAERVGGGGRLVLSGILSEQRDAVIGAYAAHGLVLDDYTQRDEWIAPQFRRPP